MTRRVTNEDIANALDHLADTWERTLSGYETELAEAREQVAALTPIKESWRALKHELTEAQSEIQRHHDDFGAISRICEAVLDGHTTAPEPEVALRFIRNIVG